MMAAITTLKVTAGISGRQSWSQVLRVGGCFSVQHRQSSDKVPIKLAAMKRGTGGRSSFSGIVATVFGATGFLGRHVCNGLGKIGSQLIIPYRCEAYETTRLRLVGDLGQVLFFPFHLRDEAAIRKVVQYSNVVINLIGSNYETKNFSFDGVNVEGAQRLARIAKEAGVEKFIHVSHLNAKENPQKIWRGSEYLRSKYESELAVREEFPEAIIFKSADMFGDCDKFLLHYMKKSRWVFRRIPLWKNGEHTIKQPVYVGDVAEGIVQAVKNPDLVGKNIECVGPQRYYLADIIDYLIRIVRREDELSRTDFTFLLRQKAKFLEKFPNAPSYSLDKLEMEGVTDWSTPGNLSLEDLGVPLTQFPQMARFVLFPLRKHAYYWEELGEFADPEPPKPAEFYQTKPASYAGA